MENTIVDPVRFQQEFKAILQKSTGDHNVSVKCLGSTIIVNVRAEPDLILKQIFEPLLNCQPTWKVKARGWHDIYIETRGLDYNRLLHTINTKVWRQK